jgi:hypothetical protein
MRYDQLLERARLASDVVTMVADGAIEVPGLKTAASLISKMIEIAQVRLC